MDWRGWADTLKRTLGRFRDDGMTDWGAALTYYAVLAVFPGLIALVAVLGVVGSAATDPLLENLQGLAPGPANDVLTGAIEEVAGRRGTAGLAFVIGLLGALWSASGYLGAFTRASNAIYGVSDERPAWKARPQQIAVTFALIVLLAMLAIGIVVSGPLAEELGDLVGAGDTAVTAWGIAKWPVIALGVVAVITILFRAAPGAGDVGLRWITPGAALALAVWLATSAGFTFYVSNFASYNATYGSIAGVIVFLVWLWISNLALLLGAELNAEVEGGEPAPTPPG